MADSHWLVSTSCNNPLMLNPKKKGVDLRFYAFTSVIFHSPSALDNSNREQNTEGLVFSCSDSKKKKSACWSVSCGRFSGTDGPC